MIKLFSPEKTSKKEFLNEVNTLLSVRDMKGFPKLIDWGVSNLLNKVIFFIVQEKLLLTLLDFCDCRLSIKNIMEFGLSILDRIQ